PWFPCPCCPPNIARLLASLPGYFYNTSMDGIWINLYASSEAGIEFKGKKIKIEQVTNYPWEGRILIKVYPEVEDEFAIYFRIPGWAEKAKVYINEKLLDMPIRPSTYLRIERLWREGDIVKLDIEMPIKLFTSNPMVIHNTSKVAIERGPLIYCLEQADNPGVDVWNIALTTESTLKAVFEPSLLNGVMVIEGTGYVLEYDAQRLYTDLGKFSLRAKKTKFRAIPYYAWSNREPGPMSVWIPLLDLFEKKVVRKEN
ncbi:MAG: glycoside hydrolase family 127 protein, partial [Thermofilaceae archaeon]